MTRYLILCLIACCLIIVSAVSYDQILSKQALNQSIKEIYYEEIPSIMSVNGQEIKTITKTWISFGQIREEEVTVFNRNEREQRIFGYIAKNNKVLYYSSDKNDKIDTFSVGDPRITPDYVTYDTILAFNNLLDEKNIMKLSDQIYRGQTCSILRIFHSKDNENNYIDLWIDKELKVPLKSVVKYDGSSITKEYTNIILGRKAIDDRSFQVPDNLYVISNS